MKRNTLLVMLFLIGITFQSFAQPGGPDLSFNKTGKQSFTLKTNSSNDYITTSFLQPDGKLLVAGYYSGNLGQNGFICRLKATGEMDPSFGNSGRVRFEDFGIDNMSDFSAQSIALQSNGNIVLAGRYGSDGYQPAIASLLPDGTLNKQFNSNGYKVIENTKGAFGTRASLQTVQVHPATGNIIAGGGSDYLENGTASMLVVALTKDGAPFAYAAHAEFMKYQIGGQSSSITSSVRFHADSMYLGVNRFAGDSTVAGVTAISMVTGQYNQSFGNKSDPVLLIEGFHNSICNAIALTANKDILLAGYGYNGSQAYSAMVYKIKAKSESVDNSFGTNSLGGSVFQFESSFGQELSAITVDATNNILAGGYASDEFGYRYWAAARLDAGGTLMDGFDGNGLKTFPIQTTTGITSLHMVSDNYLMVGTYFMSDPLVVDGIVKRIDNTGAAVTSYANNSEATVWAKDYFATAENMTIYNGKIWLCGNIPNTGTQQNGGIAVMTAATGAIDYSFGGLQGAAAGAFIIPATPDYPSLSVRDLRFQGNKLIVAATYFNDPDDEIVLMRFNLLGNSLELDTEFGDQGYAVSNVSASGTDRIQGLLVQDNGNIVVYGYLGEEGTIAVLGFKANGKVDGFAGTGAYILQDSTSTDPGERKTMDGKILSNGNLAFTTSILGHTSNSSDVFVFILGPDGALVSSEVYDLFDKSADGANSLAEKADHSLFIGGYSNDAYTILSLTTTGVADTNFDGDGIWVTPPRDTYNERVVGLYVNGQSLVAVGRAYDEVAGGEITTAMRLTLKGRNDSTFLGKGYTIVGDKNEVRSSLLANDRLYLAGYIEVDAADMVYGDVYKILLGTGPVIKQTKLQLTDLAKTYGDAPFLLKPITNSPAPVTYSITYNGNKASVDAVTGLVTIKEATNGEPVTIQISQPAVSGYTAATAYASLSISKAIPKITFNTQGDTLGEIINLLSLSSSDGIPDYEIIGGDPILELVGNFNNQVYIYGEGCARLSVHYPETNNYLEGYSQTNVCGYLELIPPAAFDDEVDLIYPVQGTVTIDVLDNDESYTGTIVPSAVDLNPDKAGIDAIYISPAMGKFETNAFGMVTFTAFEGFIGTGYINYVIYDSKGSRSEAAKITVNITATVEVSSLQATELFTPNDDGLNDAFVIGYMTSTKQNKLWIYDRNGQELFTKNNYNNDWNGDLPNGKKAENGIYYFVFTEGDGDGSRELKGAVELRR